MKWKSITIRKVYRLESPWHPHVNIKSGIQAACKEDYLYAMSLDIGADWKTCARLIVIPVYVEHAFVMIWSRSALDPQGAMQVDREIAIKRHEFRDKEYKAFDLTHKVCVLFISLQKLTTPNRSQLIYICIVVQSNAADWIQSEVWADIESHFESVLHLTSRNIVQEGIGQLFRLMVPLLTAKVRALIDELTEEQRTVYFHGDQASVQRQVFSQRALMKLLSGSFSYSIQEHLRSAVATPLLQHAYPVLFNGIPEDLEAFEFPDFATDSVPDDVDKDKLIMAMSQRISELELQKESVRLMDLDDDAPASHSNWSATRPVCIIMSKRHIPFKTVSFDYVLSL